LCILGLGLSTRLQDLGVPRDGMLLPKVIAFNVGVEIGQLLAIVVTVLLGKLFVKLVNWSKAERAANGGLAAAGLVAAIVLSVLAITQPAGGEVISNGNCTVSQEPQAISGDGGHPGKEFTKRWFADPRSRTPQ
jgi:hypothetical protein